MSTLLIVEDEPGLARFLTEAVAEAGYSADSVGDGVHAVEKAQSRSYDLILLDVMLPGMDGFSVCRRLRADGLTIPILILTAKDTLEDKIEGLDSGADDFIVKPFQLAELLARIRALLRRSAYGSSPLHVSGVTLDPSTRQATRDGKHISLSATEYSLLEFLMRHPGQVLTREEILKHVWQYDFGGNDNVLDVYISYLRAKLDRGRATPLIHTVRGVGFRIGE
jgi:DNA-binding response OmpR family regulator